MQLKLIYYKQINKHYEYLYFSTDTILIVLVKPYIGNCSLIGTWALILCTMKNHENNKTCNNYGLHRIQSWLSWNEIDFLFKNKLRLFVFCESPQIKWNTTQQNLNIFHYNCSRQRQNFLCIEKMVQKNLMWIR